MDDLDEADETYARRTTLPRAPDDEGHPEAWTVFDQLLKCLATVCGSADLVSSAPGRRALVHIIRDLAGADADDSVGSNAVVPLFAHIFSRLRGFLPMLRTLPACVDVLRVLESLLEQSRRLTLALVQESGNDPEAENMALEPVVALGEELSQVARHILQRRDLYHAGSSSKFDENGGASTNSGDGHLKQPAKVLAYTVGVHLEHSAERLQCLEGWAGNVLPLLLESGGSDDEGGNEGGSGDEAAAAQVYPTLTKGNFTHFFSPLLMHLTTELRSHDLDEGSKGRDPRALSLLMQRLVVAFQLAITMTRVPGLQTPAVLLAALKEGRKFVEQFLKAMPLMRDLLEHHRKGVLDIWKELQASTRQMQSLAAHGKANKVGSLAREAPAVRKVLESLIFHVKAAMTSRVVTPVEAAEFFSVGTLKARNVDGSVWVAPEPEEEEEDEEDEAEYSSEDEIQVKKRAKKGSEKRSRRDEDSAASPSTDKSASKRKKRTASASPPPPSKPGKSSTKKHPSSKKPRGAASRSPPRDADATDSESEEGGGVGSVDDEEDQDGYGSLVASDDDNDEEGDDKDEESEQSEVESD